MSDLLYRTCKHNGEKSFDEQSRLLTYRGNTYLTRVFKIQASASEAGANIVELFSASRAA